MKNQTGKIRIIGGTHKGRIIRFPSTKELRPSPDRVRETLFNWLTPHIENKRCLDLFAGSGALGFEAASRGARFINFVEVNHNAAKSLENNIQNLGLGNAQVHRQHALSFLKHCSNQFDVIFLDPPFGSELLDNSIQLIEKQNLITTDGLIYIELSSHDEEPDYPDRWERLRSTKAGDVRAYLVKIKNS